MQIFSNKEVIHENQLLIRSSLFSKLDTHIVKKVITVIAGTGYGKTTLISSYLQQNAIDHVWYVLHSTTSLLQEFLTYLHSYLRKHIDQNIEKLPINEQLYAVKKLLSDYPKQLWIIMDGSEFLKLENFQLSLLNSFVNDLPGHITFALIGKRLHSEIPLSKWKMQGHLLSISQKELCFNEAELQYLFQSIYHLPLCKFEMDRVLQETEGWPAAVILFREAVKDLPTVQREQFWDKFREGNDLYQYLMNEFIVGLPDHLRKFLYSCCLCPTIEKDILEYVNPSLSVTNALQELDNRDVIISYNCKGELKLHELFRIYLYKMATVELGEETIQAFHRRLSHIYFRKYRFFDAFSQSLAGGDKKMTADIMRFMVDRYDADHFLKLIDGWLERVSPTLDLSKISLFLFRCIPLQLSERLIEPLQLLLKNNSSNSAIRLNIHHRIATIYFYKGELKEAVNEYTKSLEISKQYNNAPMVALNTSMLAQMYRFMNSPDKAISLAKEALLLAEGEGHKQTQMHALWNLAEIMIDNGDLEVGRRFALQAVDISLNCDEAAVIYPLCTISKYYRKVRLFKEAFKWIEKAIKQAEKFQINTDLGWVYHEIAMCYKESGEYEKAKNFIMKADLLFQSFLHHRCIIHLQFAEILTHLQMDVEAKKVLEEIRKTIEHNYYDWIKVPEIQLVEPMEKLTLKLLGTFEVCYGNKPIKITRKASRRLLFLLSSYYKRSWSKEEIIGRLFPDDSEDCASNQFFVALSQLRKELEPNLKKGKHSSFIEFDGSHYQFKIENVDFDVKVFEDFIYNQKNKNVSVEFLINLYGGDLLEEYPYEEFLYEKRTELKNAYIKFLNSRIIEYIKGDCLDHLDLLFEKLIQADPYDEQSYLNYIDYLLRRDLRIKAQQIGNRAIRFFKQELNISIEKEIGVSLKEKIK